MSIRLTHRPYDATIVDMKQVTTTVKIKFHNLNQAKSDLFNVMTLETTSLANELLKLDKIAERRKLTTAKVVTNLMSALSNQVIRQVKGKVGKKTKQFKVLPPEVNNQNWRVFKVGDTYSVSFPTLKGTKRVPLAVQDGHWRPILDKLIANSSSVQAGSLKIIKHRGKWYAFISITQEVPEVQSRNRVGIDRGQNNLAVAAPNRGFGRFFSGQEVKHKRRHFQQQRKQLQAAGKYRAVKKSGNKEAKWMDAVNHTVSRRLVDFANYLDADVVLEDLTGCRQTMKQSRNSRSDNGQSRHAWAFYDLEQKVIYKMELRGRTAHKRPAAYTSKTSSIDGQLGLRDGHWFHAPSGEKLNADLNACWNLSQWDGFSCSLDLQRAQSVMGCADSESGVFGNPHSSNTVSQPEMGSCNSMNTVRGRVEWVQLSLFDTTSAGAIFRGEVSPRKVAWLDGRIPRL